jgi:hypothetical protein
VVVVQIEDRVVVDHQQKVEEVVASMVVVVGNYYSYHHHHHPYSSYPCWEEEDRLLVQVDESWDVPNYVHPTHH